MCERKSIITLEVEKLFMSNFQEISSVEASVTLRYEESYPLRRVTAASISPFLRANFHRILSFGGSCGVTLGVEESWCCRIIDLGPKRALPTRRCID